MIRSDSPKSEFPCQTRLFNSYDPYEQHAEILDPACRCKSDKSLPGE